ncbi:MAG: type II toxin-antitoxin system RelE/ParE family toxin [Thermomicrobiales bacterium]
MSGRKPAVRLTGNAGRDVATILFHTRRTWGEERRAAYRASIFSAFDHLRDHPHIGLRRDDLLPGCRSLPVEQHVIYYHLSETSSDELEVLRVLHARQNPEHAFRD